MSGWWRCKLGFDVLFTGLISIRYLTCITIIYLRSDNTFIWNNLKKPTFLSTSTLVLSVAVVFIHAAKNCLLFLMAEDVFPLYVKPGASNT